jgi:hypothetical protein
MDCALSGLGIHGGIHFRRALPYAIDFGLSALKGRLSIAQGSALCVNGKPDKRQALKGRNPSWS